jgi:hypothetical protein
MASPSGVLEAITERPRELLDDLDLRDRAAGLSRDVQKRRKDLRKRSKKAAKRTRKLTAEALDRAEDLRGRIGDPRERAAELRDAAVDASESVRDRAEDLEPVLRKLAIDVLTVFRGLIGVLMAVPRLIVRGLGFAGQLIDRAELARQKGHEYSERALDAAHNLPLSRRMRWRRRVSTTLLIGLAFAVGFAVGWVLAQRALDEVLEEVVDDVRPPLQPVEDPVEETVAAEDRDEPETGTGA